MSKADIGIIGLAVMGENLVMNLESKGFTTAVYNIEGDVTNAFINGRAKGKNILPAYTLAALVAQLAPPRKIMMMIRAGKPVDDTIGLLLPLLGRGDVIIDGGNSYFKDTIRRAQMVESAGCLYVGAGVSGGEEGALKGPSVMPGGSQKAWPLVKPILQAIAAKVSGSPCCQWVGESGAGHFVKMVHNGIEYGDMQLIGEAYQLMRDGLGMAHDEMQEVFARWNEGRLNSYLIEITRDILAHKDTDGSPLVEKILDSAGQKGTGKWAVVSALDEGVPLTLIGEAVFSRCLSAAKQERVQAATVLAGPSKSLQLDKQAFIGWIEDALFAAKMVSYAQGFALMRSAAKAEGWQLNYGDIALMWRGGCIIRSAFLGEIKKAFDKSPGLCNLMLSDYFKQHVAKAQAGWRNVCAAAIQAGIPLPAMASALAYYDAYRCANLPANLLQAQRDYFGAHTYQRLDTPGGKAFHTNWTGAGGSTSSTTYNA